MKLTSHCLIKLFVIFSILMGKLAVAQYILPNHENLKSLGNATCASSTCHGSVDAWKSSNVLQNEFVTWSKLDKHSQAYKVLFNDQSKRIVKNLGLKQPAHEAQMCLTCHAHAPSQNLRAESFKLTDGVSCEGCHGPAQKWISTHTVKGVTHAENIRNGLYPTDQPVAKAKLCLSCHQGDENRNITHRIMGAGHPRLSFELGTFEKLEPMHYQIDEDYIARKSNYSYGKNWAAGQVVSAQLMLEILSNPKTSHDGLFPELTLYDCHSCHHPMREKKWAGRNALPPGVLRLNDSSLVMVKALKMVFEPTTLKSYDEAVQNLHKAVSDPTGASLMEKNQEVITRAQVVITELKKLIPVIEKANYDDNTMRVILRAFVSSAQVGSYTDYASAEQIYMVIANMSKAMTGGMTNSMANTSSSSELTKAVNQMRVELADEDKFQSKKFVAVLNQIRRVVEK